ncbi:MAG: DNA mismatch repair endonuclease MutL, partial [bacterium]|nr:DNA mismatch repair endonuclease MutL [bacterium]
MAKVKLLEKTVAERIAAGEVVERPASIIKELVENSLDAGATRIVVEIKAGGIKALRVSDNGCGMSADDMALAIQRFATSKISDWNDLASLTTLGFRGEALPSIAAVSRMRIKSCLPDQEGGAELYVEGAGVPLIKPCACPPGTRIEVGDLFYNTPARLKFLRSPVAEATNIIDMLGRMAVAHPEVHFRLISNDKEVFSFPIGMAMPQRLVKLWKIPDNTLIPIARASGDMVIDGYIALPFYTRNNRNNQLILLNGRVIRSSNLSQALQEGFSPLLPRGRFPVGAIRLFLPPDSFDVNVHPNKLEVRFVDTRPVFSLVYGAVAQALEQYQADTVQERHLSYSKSDASARGATVPLRGLPTAVVDGAKTAIDNLPASRPPGAAGVNMPRPTRLRTDVEGKNHGLMGIINRIDAVNANLFPISASEKALAKERENAQRSAEGTNSDLEGTIAVSMPHLAMRELAGYELLDKDGAKAIKSMTAPPSEPKPVFDGADTIGVGTSASSSSSGVPGFNGVDTLGCAEAQGLTSADSKGKTSFSGADTMGFAVIEQPKETPVMAKEKSSPVIMVSEKPSREYVTDPLADTVIGYTPGKSPVNPSSSAAGLAGNVPSSDPLAATLAVRPSAADSAPAADPLAATLAESSPVADPLAATLSEGVPAADSAPAADPLAATLIESAP